MSEMADFGETAALRECSQRVKHHVFLQGNVWERVIGDLEEVVEVFAIGAGRKMGRERKWNCQKTARVEKTIGCGPKGKSDVQEARLQLTRGSLQRHNLRVREPLAPNHFSPCLRACLPSRPVR